MIRFIGHWIMTVTLSNFHKIQAHTVAVRFIVRLVLLYLWSWCKNFLSSFFLPLSFGWYVYLVIKKWTKKKKLRRFNFLILIYTSFGSLKCILFFVRRTPLNRDCFYICPAIHSFIYLIIYLSICLFIDIYLYI